MSGRSKPPLTCKCHPGVVYKTEAELFAHRLRQRQPPNLFPTSSPAPKTTTAEEIQNNVFSDTLLGSPQSDSPLGQPSPLWTSRRAVQLDTEGRATESHPSSLADANVDEVDAAVARFRLSKSKLPPEPVPSTAELASMRRLPNGRVISGVPKTILAANRAFRFLHEIAIGIADNLKYVRNPKSPEDVALAKIRTTYLGRELSQIKNKSPEVVAKKKIVSHEYHQLLGECEEQLLRHPMTDPIPVDSSMFDPLSDADAF